MCTYLSLLNRPKRLPMNLPVLFKSTALASLLLLVGTGLKAQGCTNTTAYPFGVVTIPDPYGALDTISTCSYLQEYSEVGPAVAGGMYTFTVTGGGYITVHEGTFDGTVIAVTHDRWFARSFDRFVVFGESADVYESSVPVWDERRAAR